MSPLVVIAAGVLVGLLALAAALVVTERAMSAPQPPAPPRPLPPEPAPPRLPDDEAWRADLDEVEPPAQLEGLFVRTIHEPEVVARTVDADQGHMAWETDGATERYECLRLRSDGGVELWSSPDAQPGGAPSGDVRRGAYRIQDDRIALEVGEETREAVLARDGALHVRRGSRGADRFLPRS